MAGRQVLALVIGVRIPAPQHMNAPVAQLDRALRYGRRGWGFESSRVYNLFIMKHILSETAFEFDPYSNPFTVVPVSILTP